MKNLWIYCISVDNFFFFFFLDTAVFILQIELTTKLSAMWCVREYYVFTRGDISRGEASILKPKIKRLFCMCSRGHAEVDVKVGYSCNYFFLILTLRHVLT